MVPKPPFLEEPLRLRERKHFTRSHSSSGGDVGFTPRLLKFQSLNSVLLPREIILESLENSEKYEVNADITVTTSVSFLSFFYLHG